MSPPIRFGRYLLREKLGQGGMGEAWKAELTGPGGYARTLVVKRCLPSFSSEPSLVSALLREARVSARLNHRNIVQVFELGEVDGQAFLSMEYVEGVTVLQLVRALLDGAAPFDAGLAALILRDVCRALGYLHALADEEGRPLGILHRDVTPQNVMVSVDGAVKLLDFGIAKVLAEAGDGQTREGVLRGKLGYVAPEQLDGLALDRRADLYSAGVVLHELASGRRLFEAPDLDGQRRARRSPPRPSSLRAGVPEAIDAICARALTVDRAARFRDGEEMAAALDQVVAALGAREERLAEVVRRVRGIAPRALPASITASAPPAARRAWRRPGWAALGVAALAVIGAVAALEIGAAKRPPIAPPPVATIPPAAAPPESAPPPPDREAPPQPARIVAAPPPRPPARVRPPRRRAARPPVRDIKHGQIVSPF